MGIPQSVHDDLLFFRHCDAPTVRSLTKVRAGLAARQSKIDAVLSRNGAQANAFGLRGTPALVIGGTLYRHGLSVADLKVAVAKARAA